MKMSDNQVVSNDYMAQRKQLMKEFPLTTLRALYDVASQRYQNQIAFKEIIEEKVVCYSYNQFTSEMNALGTCLMDMGFEGCNMAVLGGNSYSWVLAYLTTALMGTIVTLDKELTASDMKILTENADCEYMFVSVAYLDRAREIKGENEKLKGLFVWGNVDEDALQEGEWSFNTLIQRGEKLLNEGSTAYLSREIKPKDVAAIVFTSGTTGLNKGVMLTHKNICSNITGVAKGFPPFVTPTFSVLPMTHAYEMNCSVLVSIYFGHEHGINSSLKNLIQEMRIMKPAMMLVVPMFIEKFYHSIWLNAKKRGIDGELKKALKASKVSLAMNIDIRERLFKDVYEIFGGNLRVFVCGGAPLKPEIAQGMTDFGFMILQGYGITECSPLVAMNKEKNADFGSVGKPVPGTKVKIDNPDKLGIGEVLVKSNSCTIGYYKDPDATAQVFMDGWYRTGDYGSLDPKGRLWLYGRKKNLIILDNGKNVYPEEIEWELSKALPYIEDVVVYEDLLKVKDKERQYITAAISLIEDSEVALMPEEERNRVIREAIQKVNKSLAAYKRVEMFYSTTEPFKKNAAKKIMRRSVLKNQDAYIKV